MGRIAEFRNLVAIFIHFMRKLLFTLMLSLNAACVFAQERTPTDLNNNKEAIQKRLREVRLENQVLKGGYATVGLGYVAGPSPLAPYKQGASIDAGAGYALFGNRLVLDINITGDFLFTANNGWYGQLLTLSANEKISMGYYDMATVGLMPVLFNHKHDCLAAGIFGGIDIITLGTPDQQRYPLSPYKLSIFTRGFKVYYYPDEGFLFFAQLNLVSENEVSIDPRLAPYDNQQVNFYTINVGVAGKFNW